MVFSPKQPPLTEWVKVATVDELSDGQMIDCIAGDIDICLAYIGGKYYAINNICSHFFTWLSGGEIFPETLDVQCPLHDSRFSFETGEPTGPPADQPVEIYGVRIEGNDILVGPKNGS